MPPGSKGQVCVQCSALQPGVQMTSNTTAGEKWHKADFKHSQSLDLSGYYT